MLNNFTKTLTVILVWLAVAITPYVLFPPTATMQAKKPISKDGLIKAVKLNGLSTSELVQNIQQRGVEFQLTPAIEQEMRSAGARPEVIDAAKSNYRPNVASVRTNPPGPKGRPTGRRGPSVPVRYGPTYDDLYDQATAAVTARDTARATQLLQQAISMDSSQPRAFGLLGFTQLYLQRDFAAAQMSMRAAIDRGGSAVFRVYHDHNKVTAASIFQGKALQPFKSYCEGSLFITRTELTFKADDGVHTFAATGSNIKEIGTNSGYGVNLSAFHIKLKKDTGGKNNYNFAPATGQKAEAQSIVNFVNIYQRAAK